MIRLAFQANPILIASTDSVLTPSQTDSSSIQSPTDILSSADVTLTPSHSDSSNIPSSSDLAPTTSQSGPSSIPIIDLGSTSSTAFPSQSSEDAATRSTGLSNSREAAPSSTPSAGLVGSIVSDLLSGTTSSTESDSSDLPSPTKSVAPSQTELASTPTETKTSGGASTGSDATSSSGIFPTIPVSVPLVTPSASSGSLDVPGALSTALGLTSQVTGTPVSSFQPGPSGSSATSALIVPGGSTSDSRTGTHDVTESQSATVSQSATGSQSATASQSETANLSSSTSLGTSAPPATTSGPVIPTGTKSGSAGVSSTALISSKAPSASSTNPATPISTGAPAPTSTEQPSQPGTTQPSTQPPPQPSTAQPSTQPPPQPTTTQPSTQQPAPPSTTQPAVETTPTPEPVPEPTPEPTTQASTSSDNDDWVPSTILVEPPTPTTHDSVTHATATSTSTQVQLPGNIAPNEEQGVKPKDGVLIRLGFDERLRYSFVATTMLSSTQIFHFVPKGLQYTMGLSSEQVSMSEIKPLQMNGYLATTVYAWVSNNTYLYNTLPANSTKFESKLDLEVKNPVSNFYNEPDESVNTLFSMIDPTISIWPNGVGPPGFGGKPGNGSGNGNDNEDNNGGGNGDGGASGSSSARPSSVGIGVGVVAGAAAYGAGMFWVARRYRKKRQLHQRSSSTVEQMSEGRGGGSVFAAGGRMSRNSQVSRGGSARTQMISAPVMAENSLGWN
ncbi:putative mucin family signaling protein Msb2 [Aspergillus melleus]|uniref:putative mucin family signaling protein Msb2 n=1 Tax=Aspergillus melleus TaxID=138277 RepID=UPI001E8CDBAD|nr:multicopy suppressor of a budding defect [Aspergillus melleus]KAH8430274.1 multicopy suppressor of a budding defect [Aspergillus melleus]